MPPGIPDPPDRTNRAVAALIAAFWLAGGLGALFAAVTRHRLLGFVVGPLGIGYGVLWLRVVVTGRRRR
jgi:hypothetical protein